MKDGFAIAYYQLLRTRGLLGLIAAFAAASASAYQMPPDPGLSMTGAFVTLIVIVVLAVVCVLFYPLRLLLRRNKNKKP